MEIGAATLTESSRQNLTVRVRKRVNPDFEIDVNLTVPPGITILFGASGAGKTTLLDLICGPTTPDAGFISAGDGKLFDSSANLCVPVWKRRIGYVFQDLALFPHLSAAQNVEYGLRKLEQRERQRRRENILEQFRLADLRGRRPGQLSGGERQRVALARALVTDPLVLLLDEPLSALDRRTKSGIVDDLRRWNREHGIPILYVTHSQEEVFALGERVVLLEKGKVIAQGTPHEVMRAPRLETVAALSGFENVFDMVVSSIHEERGTMSCRLADATIEMETPIVWAEIGSQLRLGIRAGDILLATEPPRGLSARNVIPGKLVRLERRDVIVSAWVDCGVEVEVQLTLAAQDSLRLVSGRDVWLVIKTHSCHLMSAQ